MTRLELQVDPSERKMRLEDFLFERFPGLSRMYLRETVKADRCEVNGSWENRGYRLRPGDFIEIELDPSRANAMRAEELPLRIVFEDDYLLVVDKPAGMLVHPTHRDKDGTLLNALVFHLNGFTREREILGQERSNKLDTPHITKSIRPGLVHRLDKETSGLVVVAKNVRAHRILARQFQKKTIVKKYIGLVEGEVRDDIGTIEAPIGRYADQKFWNVKVDGKPAVTKFRVLERGDTVSLLELEPITGRTNQLRIHCSFMGHPIVGDHERFGRAAARLFLHAYKLEFRHPENGATLAFSAELPFGFGEATCDSFLNNG